jgi:general secretion pathway protein F
MPQFRYRAVTQAGELVSGEVEAPNRDEVLRRIEYLGHLPIEAEPAGAGGALARVRAAGGKPPRARDVTALLRELAFLIRAGLTLEETLQTLGEDAARAVARFVKALRSSIAAGDSFAEALERHPAVIEPAYVAMVRAGEASGKLDRVLHAIVEDRTRRERLAERVGSAIRYPAFLVGAAVLILVFFLIYVVPQFEPVFKDLGGKLNAGAAFILAASGWLRANLDMVLGSCAALALLGWLAFSQAGFRARLRELLGSLPGVAGALRDLRAARITGILGMLVGNGVALPAALKLLRAMNPEPRVAAAIDQVHDGVRSGRRFADALAETDLLPPLAVRMLRVGDEAGDLPSVAAHASQFYEHKLGTSLDRLMGAIGPITIVLVSLLIGALVVSIMSALLSITELAL